jgi:murein DD-endopeptidase MepM/ murein hydrolase activator NlpD
VIVAAMLLLPIRAALAQPAMFTLPIQPACVSSPFGPRAGGGPKASHDHTGIDLPGPAGTMVHAAADGAVAAIHRRGAGGLEVELRHANGWVTRYDHLGSVAPALASGKRKVGRGETLGRIGRSGVTYGTHLHFEVLSNGLRVDPASVLAVAPCPNTKVIGQVQSHEADQ